MKKQIVWALILMFVLSASPCFAEAAEATKAPEQTEETELHLLWDIPFGSSMEECIELAQANAGVTLKKVEGKDDQLEANIGSFPIFLTPSLRLTMDFDDTGLYRCILKIGDVYTENTHIYGEDKHATVIEDAITYYRAIELMLVRQYGHFSRSLIYLQKQQDSSDIYAYDVTTQDNNAVNFDSIRDAARKYPYISWGTEWNNIYLICIIGTDKVSSGFVFSVNYSNGVAEDQNPEGLPYHIITSEG